MKLALRIVSGLLLLAVAFGVVTWVALEGREVAVLHTRSADGESRSTRVWVADSGGAVWVEAANPERPFYMDILNTPAVQLERQGRQEAFTA